jgi:hypothetical protein
VTDLPPLTDAEVAADPELCRLLEAANVAAARLGEAAIAEDRALNAYRVAHDAIRAHRVGREADQADARRAAAVRESWEWRHRKETP